MTTQMLTGRITNGVAVDQLLDTIQAIQLQPDVAKFRFRATNEWQDAGHNVAEISGLDGACQRFERSTPHRVELDEPPVLLSADRGANPVEVLLAALSGCLTTSLVYHAAAMGIDVDEVESTYEGSLDLHGFLGLDPNVRNGYESIRVTFSVTAPGATDEQIDDLIRIAQERSPVFDVLSTGTNVSVERAK